MSTRRTTIADDAITRACAIARPSSGPLTGQRGPPTGQSATPRPHAPGLKFQFEHSADPIELEIAVEYVTPVAASA